MSTGILIKYKHDSEYICGNYIDSYYELEDKIKDAENWLSNCKERLRQLATCTPKDLFPESKENGDTLFQLNREFDDIWDSIEETNNNLDRLYRIKKLVDENSRDDNGKRIDMYNKENWNKVVVLDN